MADTSFSDSSASANGTTIVAAFLNSVNKLLYWGRNPIYVTTGGSANAQTITLPGTSLYSAYAAGDQFTAKAGFTNTSSMTLQVIGASSLAATSVKNPDGSNPRAGQVTAGGIYTFVYEATAGVFIITSLPGSMTGTGAMVFGTSPTLVTPTLGVASATSLATSAASPLLMTNGQLATVALTSQTVGAVTLTIPDFASVADEFTFKTKSQTLANKTLAAPVFTGAVNEQRRASIYQYTAWDPSDVAGTLTNASSTAAATSTATDYVTVANSSGTLTFTCVKAGVYCFTITGQNEFNAGMTAANFEVVTGGTGTIYLGTSTLKIFSYVNGTLQPMSGTGVFYASMTAAQTVTILPKFSVTSGGVTTNFTQQCTVSAEYTGAN